MRLDSLTEAELPVTIDRYTLTALLGEGGMARVFQAQMDGALGFKKPAAVKVVLRGSGERGDSLRKQLIQEARLGGLLNHPNVVQTFDCGDLGGFPFIAMELVDGVGLSELIESSGALPPGAVLDVAIQVAKGLHHAHTASHEGRPLQIIHRDIKPSNILVREDGVVKVMDFGIAKVSMSDALATESGTTKGTPSYMSPEQLAGKGMDARTDLFALGAVIYSMLSGRTLFTGGSVTEVMMRIIQVNDWVRGQKVEALAEAAVPGLGPVVLQLLQHDLEERPANASLVAAELERLRRTLPGDSGLTELVGKTLIEKRERQVAQRATAVAYVASREGGSGPVAVAARGAGGIDSTRSMGASHGHWNTTEAVPPRPGRSTPRTAVLVPQQEDLEEPEEVPDSEARALSTQSRGSMPGRKKKRRSSSGSWAIAAGLSVLGLGILAFALRSSSPPAPQPEPATKAAPDDPAPAAAPPDLSLAAAPSTAPETTANPRPVERISAPTPAPAPEPKLPKENTPSPKPDPTPAFVPEPTPKPAPDPTPKVAVKAALNLTHSPVSRATAGTTKGITMTVEGPDGVRVTVHYGPSGGPFEVVTAQSVGNGVFRASVPIPATGALDYWIEARHPDGEPSAAFSGSKAQPHRIAVF